MTNPTQKLKIRFYDQDALIYEKAHRELWLDANQSSQDMREALEDWRNESPYPIAENWGIDQSAGFGKLDVRLWTLDQIALAAYLIEEHGDEHGRDEIIGWLYREDDLNAAFLDQYDDDEVAAMDDFKAQYLGDAESWTAWVRDTDTGSEFLGLGDLQKAAQESDQTHDYGDGGNNTTAITALARLTSYIDWELVAEAIQEAGEHRTYQAPYALHIYRATD
jgi:hypothetical protein